MMKLMLYDGTQAAWDMLQEWSGLYGDNRGDPDGNCWLPSGQADIPNDVMQRVVQNGLGTMVRVLVATDEGMVNYLAQYDANAVLGLRVKLANDEWDEEEDTRCIKGAAYDSGLQWAHYGAYGAGDSHWVFVKPEEE